MTTHKGWVTGASLSKICSDTLPAHRKTHIKSSFQTQKHNFSVSQSVWSKSFWLKHTSSSHLLVPSTLSLYSLLFLLPFFFIFIPPPFPFASRIGSHLLFFLFLHVSPSLFCFDSENKFLKEAGVSFFVLLAHLLCSFSLPVCHNMGLMKELAAFCLLSNIK